MPANLQPIFGIYSSSPINLKLLLDLPHILKNNPLRYFVEISYKGYNYRGWQRQPDVPTIQETIEHCISRVLHKPITCIGCGRTDAMVHASQFFFHFDFYNSIDFDLKFRLNKMLPADISIINIYQVDDYPHAQFSAISRTYDYLIHTHKDPFLGELSALYPLEFNIPNMHRALHLIPGQSDFANLCLCPSHQSTTLCEVSSVKLLVNSSAKMLRVRLSANRFLQGMMRIIVKQLIDVGTGQMSLEEFEAHLNGTKKITNHKPAYPQGLYLSEVRYPFLNLTNTSTFFRLMDDALWEEIQLL